MGTLRLRPPRRHRRGPGHAAGGLPGLLGGIVLGPLGYLWAEEVLLAQPHPMHWAAALATGAIGYLGARAWGRGS